MRRYPFNKAHRISKSIPMSDKRNKVIIQDVAGAISRIAEYDFGGLIDVNINFDRNLYAAIDVAEDYTAYALKLIIMHVHGAAVLNVDIENDRNNFIMRFSTDTELPKMELEDYLELVRVARIAGFDIVQEGLITLTAKLTSAELIVRAISLESFIKALRRILLN